MQAELRDSDRAINDLFGSLLASRDAAGKIQLRDRQRDWLRQRDSLCHLNSKIADREIWLQDLSNDNAKMVCVVTLTRLRVAELKAASAAATAVASSASASQSAPPKNPYTTAYDNRAATTHSTGKWYFEILVKRDEVLKISPTDVLVGVSDKEHLTGTGENVPADTENRGVVRIGIAVDLDNGKLYVSRNGDWAANVPGSNRGSDVKLGRVYYSVIAVSAKTHNREYFESGAIAPNFGGQPMAYAIPPGYLAWRDSAPMSTVPASAQ